MSIYLVFIGVGLAAFLPRYLPLVLWGELEPPARAQSVLRFVPTTVLAAIVAPSLLMPSGDRIDLSMHNAYIFGGCAVLIIALISKRMLLSCFVGVAVFYAWHAFVR
jgi:branched-subunit amino acid transport protein